MRTLALACLFLGAAAGALALTRDASACGACFHPPAQTPEQESVVTGHRMVLAISTTQTVLWDQVRYAGSPDEFAWVLPIKPGSYVETASDAWIEALDAATNARVSAPAVNCPSPSSGKGFQCVGPIPVGCSSSSSASAGDSMSLTLPKPDPVTVVHEGSVGPYETVTLHSSTPGALTTWLTKNSFNVDATNQPIIDAYEKEGFDFIALRLLPNKGVQQMTPVRIVSPGADPSLPLRFVAVGTGATVALTLFVIGEGRWSTQSFPEVRVPADGLVWDFDQSRSNYATLRAAALAQNGGQSWLVSYAEPQSLLGPLKDATLGGQRQYLTGSVASTTIASAFAAQAFENGELPTAASYCANGWAGYANDGRQVVPSCAPGSAPCVPPGYTELDASVFSCGALTDLSVALTGMHPRDVWLTRLEATLPHEALAKDLVLAPAATQQPVDNFMTAPASTGTTCPGGAVAAPGRGSSFGGKRRDLSLVLLVSALAFAAGAVRRLTRPVASVRERAGRAGG